MDEEFIRHLSHDNQQLENEWPALFTQIQKFSFNGTENDLLVVKVKLLDALVDYVLADKEPMSQIKSTFLETIIESVLREQSPPLDELVRIFCRVFDVPNTNNLFNVAFIQAFFFKTRLGERLSKVPCVDLIDSILNSIEKHQFLDTDFDTKLFEKWEKLLTRGIFSPLTINTNKLNYEHMVTTMRSSFQRLYRCAAINSRQSKIWKGVIFVLECTLSKLFDSYDSPTDAKYYLTTCAESSVPIEYVRTIATSFKSDVELFKNNISEVYEIMEKFVAQSRIKELDCFIDYIIVTHFGEITKIEDLVQMSIRLCSIVHMESRKDFCDALSSIIFELTRKKIKKDLATIIFDLALSIMHLNTIKAPKHAHALFSIKEFFPWKQLNAKVTQLIQSCISYDSLIIDTWHSDLDPLGQILEVIDERAKTNASLLNATHELALQAVFKWLPIVNNDTGKPYSKFVFSMASKITSLIDRKKVTAENCSKLLEFIQNLLDPNSEIYEYHEVYDLFLRYTCILLGESLEQSKSLPITLHQQLASFFLTTLDWLLSDENGTTTVSYSITMQLWYKVTRCINNEDEAAVYEQFNNRIYQLAYEEEGEQLKLYDWWKSYWANVGYKCPNAAIKNISMFLYEIIDRKRSDYIALVTGLYSKSQEAYHARFDDIVHALFDNQEPCVNILSGLFTVIVQAHPELITAAHVDYIFNAFKNDRKLLDEAIYTFYVLSHASNAQPSLFDKHREDLINYVIEKNDVAIFMCLQKYLVASIIINGEKVADEYLTLLINLVKSIKNITLELKTQIFYTCQLIGVRHKEILAKRRNELIAFESDSSCQSLIGFIDGNKLSEENQLLITRTLDEVGQIEKRVIHTERNVENLNKVVKRQELNITNINAHVNDIDIRVNSLAEQVEYHAQEIQRIDMKTLSYVPSEWGRDVCKILNVRADNDWRLLGKRFGYTSSELKHWAMQIDPSMSLLNEWFMTHKADEATYGLLKVLSDIGRKDVEDIIRKALEQAGQLIPDDISIEIKRLPPVFISYQWGSQKAVLKLKTNLEQAGYLCWMDTGQMGGGDKLFAKIDAGIRGAKVVICCMNKAYAQSDNCSREVHLTVSTGKPLIPLQMEKQTWPPEGALGPIMSEYLYIRFYDRNTNDENYWPADRFTELLGQIRYHVAPDPDMITQEYYNWFVPRIDKLIFLQSQTTNNNKDQTKVDSSIPLVVNHPQIMISYQWDYQKDIVNLYEKLTKLGYACWLDIFQMGGGDSLFEKIDTGIRNAKCILACITPKYTKSINCRREMALSDALKKPIIPLLLEEVSTWPPAGPMSMVFAEKPYVDFRRLNDNNERWIGKEFESILARLKQLIPEVQTERPERHLMDMQRPTTATKQQEAKPKRIRSAPVIPQSRACSIM